MANALPTALSLGLIALGIGAVPADARATCAQRDKMIERLEIGYGEALAGGGLQSEERMIEVWAAPETGTWTVLMTQADGLACIMASGTNWHQQDPVLALKGVPG